MLRLLTCIIFLLVNIFPFSLFASEGYIGENPGFNFYSRIDDSAEKIISGLVKKRVKEYSTFANFGISCRKPIPWFDRIKMEQKILDEVWSGNYGVLAGLAHKDKVQISAESLQNLAQCLKNSYAQIQNSAMKQYESLSAMGSMGLYSDGDTANSDYDILSDIGKINGLIFTEELKYQGTKNGGKIGLSNLLAEKVVAPLISQSTQEELDIMNGILPEDTSSTTLTGGTTNQNQTPTTLGSLGIGSTCAKPMEKTSVTNMVDDEFLADLSIALQGNSTPDGGTTYSARDKVAKLQDSIDNSISTNCQNSTSNSSLANLSDDNFLNELTNIVGGNSVSGTKSGANCQNSTDNSSISSLADDDFLNELAITILSDATKEKKIEKGITQTPGNTSMNDFFHTPRCTSIFCITFGTKIGSNSLFGNGKNISIESILDKHIAHLEPISWQNGGLQGMTSNVLEPTCIGLSCHLKRMVKGGRIILSEKPGKKERNKIDDTKAIKDGKLELIVRCGLFSAGFTTSNLNQINSVAGAGYIQRSGVTTENIQNTNIPLAPADTDTKALQECMSLALENGRSVYYSSFNDDLSEILAFTHSMTELIKSILKEGEKIDTLKRI